MRVKIDARAQKLVSAMAKEIPHMMDDPQFQTMCDAIRALEEMHGKKKRDSDDTLAA